MNMFFHYIVVQVVIPHKRISQARASSQPFSLSSFAYSRQINVVSPVFGSGSKYGRLRAPSYNCCDLTVPGEAVVIRTAVTPSAVHTVEMILPFRTDEDSRTVAAVVVLLDLRTEASLILIRIQILEFSPLSFGS